MHHSASLRDAEALTVQPYWALSKACGLVLAAAAIFTACRTTPYDNFITEWNHTVVEAIKFETTPPPVAARNLAIFHIAVFEAVNSFDQRYEPYEIQEKAPKEADPKAAALGAALEAATSLYPSRRATFDILFARNLATLPAGPGRETGLSWGKSVAAKIFGSRIADGSTTTISYIPRTEPGQWRRTPPLFSATGFAAVGAR